MLNGAKYVYEYANESEKDDANVKLLKFDEEVEAKGNLFQTVNKKPHEVFNSIKEYLIEDYEMDEGDINIMGDKWEIEFVLERDVNQEAIDSDSDDEEEEKSDETAQSHKEGVKIGLEFVKEKDCENKFLLLGKKLDGSLFYFRDFWNKMKENVPFLE